jgi:hypothetical protein
MLPDRFAQSLYPPRWADKSRLLLIAAADGDVPCKSVWVKGKGSPSYQS